MADQKCRASTGYDAKALAIRYAHEQTWVDQHRDELDAWAERSSTHGG